jgi:hypothetical protein
VADASTSTVPPPLPSAIVLPIGSPLTVKWSSGPPDRNVLPPRSARHQLS